MMLMTPWPDSEVEMVGATTAVTDATTGPHSEAAAVAGAAVGAHSEVGRGPYGRRRAQRITQDCDLDDVDDNLVLGKDGLLVPGPEGS